MDKPFVELIERFDGKGVASVVVVCRELPAGYYCRISRSGAGYERKTKCGSKPSIRYALHGSLEAACEVGVQWVYRKVRELQKGGA
jgi:hypothetical protein